MITEAPVETRENYLNANFGVKSWLLTVDHKRIALLYLISITFFFFLGGAFAVMIRLELLTPEGDLFQSETYNKLFTMHGIVMVFFVLSPSIPATIGNFLLPLMIGARDLAFPRINLLRWYIYMVGAVFGVYAIFAGGVDTGWTFYTPYSTSASQTQVIPTVFAAFVVGFSSILTGLNFIVTTHKMRAPGLTWFRLPLFVWAMYATSLIQMLATPVLAITLVLLLLERGLHVGIFDPNLGGDPVLFQHMFWFYSHPAVYKGRVSWQTPMLYVLGFIGLFTIGGLTGLFLAAIGLDVHLTDTYFVIAHFHYIMVGGTIMAYLGGLHFWWPKITGRLYPEFWAKIACAIVFLGFNLTFFPQFLLGYMGMPRRYHAYPPEFQVLNVMSTAGASILGVGYFLPIVY